MIKIKNIKGLCYPDDYLIKLFFKFSLHKKRGEVLEFGCGNGNNLLMFQEFGWDVSGIDNDREMIEYSKYNLEPDQTDELIYADLSEGVPSLRIQKFDAILFPNVNYYIPRKSFISLLDSTRDLLDEGGVFFIRSRTPLDWRYGKGKEVEKNGFIIDRDETDEKGCLNVFYEPDEIEELVRKHIGPLHDCSTMICNNENLQNGLLINNCDIVLWGRK